MFRRFNCCCFNHPCPIRCPWICPTACRNEVVNPTFTESFGFFRNITPGTITSNAIIPLNLVQSGGSGISSTGAGAISLAAGTYEVTYFANGTIPASGTMSIKLRLNGVDVAGSIISDTQDTGNISTLTQTIVLRVESINGILELVNNSADSATFSLASMFTRRIEV